MAASRSISAQSTPYGLKDSASSAADMSAWTSAAAGLQPTTGYYPYDPTLAAYGYGAGYDLAARRKNATRESTATLKAWLNEHKKNPYPTKGEKIMLAIITKMTLTQVSTWFANARRRLKKENKMTWEPKNKTDDDDDAIVSDGEDKEKDEIVGSTALLDGSNGDPKRSQEIRRDDKEALHHVKSEHGLGKECLEDEDDLEEDERKPPGMLMPSHHAPLHHPHHHPMLTGLKDELGAKPPPSDCGVPIPATKPKIWSLADTAACKTPPPPPPHSHHQQQQQPWVMPNCAGGGGGGGPSSAMNAFAIPPSTGMSPSAAAAPYSRYGVLPYGGGGHGATAAGFPDVQTDTPPQTPPNMKLPSVAGQLLTGNSGGQNGFQQPQHQQPQSSTVNGQQQAYGTSQHHYLANYTRLQQSPHKERSGGVDSTAYHHQAGSAMMTSASGPSEGTAFKPFYKSSQPMGGGYVSPV